MPPRFRMAESHAPHCVWACLGCLTVLLALLPDSTRAVDDDPFAPWVEEDFPFFSSVLDLRHLDPESVPHNITPRGIVLNLGDGQWACFDTELLRFSAIWQGDGVTPVALAPVSYQHGSIKTRGGQEVLPRPAGDSWVLNGVYPGWQRGPTFTTADPRPPQPTQIEPGRGPLPLEEGSLRAIRGHGRDVVFEYVVAGSTIEERVRCSREDGRSVVTRHFRLAPCPHDRWLVLGKSQSSEHLLSVALIDDAVETAELVEEQGVKAIRVRPNLRVVHLSVALSPSPMPPLVKLGSWDDDNVRSRIQSRRWEEEVHTATVATSTDDGAPYVIDHLELPQENPWRRRVRLADMQFFQDGRAAAVTLDGDVWTAHGVHSDSIRWRRFTSGLHEPMSLSIRDEVIYVFDRNGVWKLLDTDGNGEADRHELFCNRFTQSAETREFPNGIQLAPDGSFVIAKGGQQASTLSHLNGSVLRLAPHGKTYETIGVGFRQPFIGVHPETGLVTACDQEGNYIPTTPLHIVKDGAFHGYLSGLVPPENYPAPIARPLTWIPHSVNPSGTSQVWLHGTKLGPLNGSLVHLGFNRPELFRILRNERASVPQAAVITIVRDFDVPALHAAVNPVDGCLYVSGFQITAWGTTATRLSAVGRLRYTGGPSGLPTELAAMASGVLLRFDSPLDPSQALNLDNYSVERWNYKRTPSYGSAHYKTDGSVGQDWLLPSSVYLSEDREAIFIGIPDMKPVMQMRLAWSLQSAGGATLSGNAYFTPHELTEFEPESEGFAGVAVDLTPRQATAPRATSVPTAAEGKRLYQLMGCMACHDAGETDQPKVGPSWKGLYGRERELGRPATTVSVDEHYLRESILDPSAKLVRGYEKREAGMPIYAGVLSESQVDSLILFIKSLR